MSSVTIIIRKKATAAIIIWVLVESISLLTSCVCYVVKQKQCYIINYCQLSLIARRHAGGARTLKFKNKITVMHYRHNESTEVQNPHRLNIAFSLWGGGGDLCHPLVLLWVYMHRYNIIRIKRSTYYV